MLGLLLTIVFAKGWMGIGWRLVDRFRLELDPALKLGISGLIGLGLAGLATFFLGLVPGGFAWGLYVMGGLVLVGLGLLTKSYLGNPDYKPLFGKLPEGAWKLIPLVLVVASIMAVVSILAPVDANEWDALAYHLAVPKQWIAAGQITTIPTIHHSNFPFVVDNLYVWGLQYGGDSGARAFQLCFYLLGLTAVFGFTRQRYGAPAAWWSALALGTVPAVVWEAGSAYIDLAHGLYAGFGVLFAIAAFSSDEGIDRKEIALAAVLLGFAAASKYTGLQTVFAVAIVVLVLGFRQRKLGNAIASTVALGAVAIAVASPWLARNVVNVGNPVYPYFYSVFRGANWDAENSAIYTNEQKSFGVGAHMGETPDPTSLGAALLGLAYQPGRFTNPRPDLGLGSPLGAVGVVGIITLLLWPISGRSRRFEAGTLSVVMISALMWFILSQQSRYIITWLIPLSVLAGAGVVKLKAGQILAAAISVQAVATLYLTNTFRTSGQLPVLLGSVSAEEYRTRTVPFAEAARDINERVKDGTVALYDEVFGHLLNVPYVWANPGHSTLFKGIPMTDDGSAYVERMKEHDVRYIYINLSPAVKDRELARLWVESMGLNGAPSQETIDSLESKVGDNWETDWMKQLSRAVRSGLVVPVQTYRNGILFEIRQNP